MWRVAGEAYAYLAGHPFLTDTVPIFSGPTQTYILYAYLNYQRQGVHIRSTLFST